MKNNIIFLGVLFFILFCFSDAKSMKRSLRRNLKSNQNLAQQFSALPKETRQKILDKFNEMRKSGNLPNVSGGGGHSNQMPYNNYPPRKSPYELRNEAFNGGNAGRQQQSMMPAGPDPFFAMRGLEIDTTKLNKKLDRWEEEAAEKAQSKGGSGGGGGMDGLGDIIGLAVKFAPMLMAFGR